MPTLLDRTYDSTANDRNLDQLFVTIDRPEYLKRILTQNLPTLIPTAQFETFDSLRAMFPGERLCVCDFYIPGAESWREISGGFECDEILSVDHHAPVKRFEKYVSSTNLAIEYVKENGPLPQDYRVIINHTDCDSILSSLIMKGVLPPEECFGQAAIAADHSGMANQIADLLQALNLENDLDFSVRNLALLLNGEATELRCQNLIEERISQRQLASNIASSSELHWYDGIAWIESETKIDSEFLVPTLPQAEIILVFHKIDHENWNVHWRLGEASRNINSLHDLQIPQLIDSAWGGRWNAGSDKRGGGIQKIPTQYVAEVAEVVAKKWGSKALNNLPSKEAEKAVSLEKWINHSWGDGGLEEWANQLSVHRPRHSTLFGKSDELMVERYQRLRRMQLVDEPLIACTLEEFLNTPEAMLENFRSRGIKKVFPFIEAAKKSHDIPQVGITKIDIDDLLPLAKEIYKGWKDCNYSITVMPFHRILYNATITVADDGRIYAEFSAPGELPSRASTKILFNAYSDYYFRRMHYSEGITETQRDLAWKAIQALPKINGTEFDSIMPGYYEMAIGNYGVGDSNELITLFFDYRSESSFIV